MTGFAFTGEMRDANGLQFHRARYYMPELGVWPNHDPLEGSIRRTQSINRYIWVENMVVNNIDSSGLAPINNNTCKDIAEERCLRALSFRRHPQFRGLPVFGNPRTDWGFGPNNFTYHVRNDADNPYRRSLGGLHNGLDFGTASGTVLRAVDDGIVEYVGSDIWGAGPQNIIVRYGNMLALYGHVSDVYYVSIGDMIHPGSRLGESSGTPGYNHLHFELRSIREDVITNLELDAHADLSRQLFNTCDYDNPVEETLAGMINNYNIALKMNELFGGVSPKYGIRNRAVQDANHFYINPIEYFQGIEDGAWDGKVNLSPSVTARYDTDGNGYPDRIALSGETRPVSYDERSILSMPSTFSGLFWDDSRFIPKEEE